MSPYSKSADESYSDILRYVKNEGEWRDTRSGKVKCTFSPPEFNWDMSDGFPLLTAKKMAVNSIIGELLWFLNGETTISDLRIRTFGTDNGQHTIWSDDNDRWHSNSRGFVELVDYDDGDLGRVYGHQWRSANGIDQIYNLINSLMHDPHSRYHIVSAWNPADIMMNKMALPPCHAFFQCFVSNDGKLSLKWYQRSVDCFLGLPFNIASYGLLLAILARITGYEQGKLTGTFGDAQIYERHQEAVKMYLRNPVYGAPKLVLPDNLHDLSDLKYMTALDFKGCFKEYANAGTVSAPLSVG